MDAGDRVRHGAFIHVIGFTTFGVDGEVVSLLCEPGKWYHCDDWVALRTQAPTCLLCVAKETPGGDKDRGPKTYR